MFEVMRKSWEDLLEKISYEMEKLKDEKTFILLDFWNSDFLIFKASFKC